MTATYDNVTRCLATAIKLSGSADSAKGNKTGSALVMALKQLDANTNRRDNATAARKYIRAARRANDLPELAQAESLADSELAAAESALVEAAEQAEKANAGEEANGLIRALLRMQDILQRPDAAAAPSARQLNDLARKVLTTATSLHPEIARFEQLVSECRASVAEAERVKSGAELAAQHTKAAASRLPTMNHAVAATERALEQADSKLTAAEAALALALNQQSLAEAPIAHLIELYVATEALLTAAMESERLSEERQSSIRFEGEEAARQTDPCNCSETTRCNYCWSQQYYPTRETGMCD